MALDILLLYGSYRQGRMGIRLADYMAAQSLIVVQDAAAVQTYAEIWSDTVMPQASRVVAVQNDEVWVITALLDCEDAKLSHFLHDQIGYIPRHLNMEWYIHPNGDVQVRGLNAAVGMYGVEETFSEVAAVGWLYSGQPCSPEQRIGMASSPEIWGLWKFCGLAAMEKRHMLAYVRAKNSTYHNTVTAVATMGQTYGIH